MTTPAWPRPDILNLVAIVSFLLSAANAVWVFVIGVLMLGFGLLGWIGGPVTGVITTVIGLGAIGLLTIQFFLSLLLFNAAWNTWAGRAIGRSRHRLWAWIIIVIDLVDLVFTGGMDPSAWIRLVYAVFLIYILDRPEVRAYFATAP